jgi:hypothetical protein
VKLFSDPSRRAHVVGSKRHLLSGVARCGKCGNPLYFAGNGKNAYRCVTGPGKGCGGVSVNAVLLDEYVTGAVLDALESPRVQEAVRAGADTGAPRRAELLEEIARRRTSAPTAVKAVLNSVTVHPNGTRSGGPNWRRELMLSYIAGRTEFDWRF